MGLWKPFVAAAAGLAIAAVFIPDARLAAALFCLPLLTLAFFDAMIEASR